MSNIPEPIWARHNRVQCPWCGQKYKTNLKYRNHFVKRHMHYVDGALTPNHPIDKV